MSRAITIPAQVQLKEYNKELQQREWHERKDKCILLSLAVAGLVGVYVLVLNGVQQNNLTKGSPVELHNDAELSTNRTAVGSLQ